MDTVYNIWDTLKTLDFRGLFTASDMAHSLVLIAIVLFVRRLLIRRVWSDAEVLSKDQRRWITRIKNACVFVLLFGLILIWAPQLHTFAISIAAFTVAVVVATKEMILCMMGAIMRVTSQPFHVGDWITIDGLTGEVVDLDAFAFRIQEVDAKGKTYAFTGRTISVPNSKLFSSNVENANFFKSYVFEDIRISVPAADADPTAASAALADIAEKHFGPLRADALAFNRKIRRRSGVNIGQAEPAFDLSTTDAGHCVFQARLFVPTGMAAKVRSSITRDFLAYIHKHRPEKKKNA